MNVFSLLCTLILMLSLFLSDLSAQFPAAPSGFDQGPYITRDTKIPKEGHLLIKTTPKAKRRAFRKFRKRRGRNPSPRQLRKQIARQFGLRVSREITSEGVLHAVGRRKNVNKINRAMERGLATIVEENYKITHFMTDDLSDDFFCSFGLCWNITAASNSLFPSSEADIDVDGPEAWEISQGEGVIVGVIDTGVYAEHPDLLDNMWINPFETENGLDDDGNGFIDDTRGWDFHNNDNNPDDDHFHGTHVAGTIAAMRGNGRGVVGVAPRAKILPLKVLGADGSGDTAGILSAIDYATDLKERGIPIKVLNASLGGGESTELIREALERANQAGIVLVAAAGNSTDNNDETSVYPANYGQALPNVVSVASIESDGSLSSFSNFGRESVHVAAPGGNVWSTIVFNFYLPSSGTSMAAPHVAGIAALVASRYPKLKPEKIRDRIMNATKPLSGLEGKIISPGTVSAELALK